MNEKIKNFLVGVALGVANIIPGVSGGTIAMTMGIYEKLISIASHFFKDIKKNIMFILPLGIGMVVAILLLSKVINFTLENYEFQTVLFFVGLIIGGIPLLVKKTNKEDFKFKNILVFIICFALIMSMTFMGDKENIVSLANVDFSLMMKLLGVGIIAAATMVIPGISGSFILMLLGFYKPIVETISNLTNFDMFIHNILILGSFGIGVLIGIVLIAKIIEFLLDKFPSLTYYGIYGIIVASIISIVLGISSIPGVFGIIIGVLLLGIGFIIGKKLS